MTKPILPPAALAQHIAVLGKTGSGKTSTAKLIIEHVVDTGARVCILDPLKSDWWGLTSSADGKKPGLPFHILGGPRGHVPLHAQAGKAIGEIVANGALPLSIIDMADFGPGDHMRFFCDFAQALLRKMRGVLYLVIEEAHEFAPKERSGIGAENMGIYWAKKIATAGRSKGIRMMVLTQRTQSLHNALLGSCETVIAHRLTAPADQKPVLDWLKSNASAGIQQMVSAQIASLKTGAGWICSGEANIFERHDFPRIKTYDNSATPEHDSAEHQVKTAPVDSDKLRTIIGDAVKDAEANDPKKLRARIVELERDAKKGHAAPAADPDAITEIQQRERAATKAAMAKAIQPCLDRFGTLLGGLTDQLETVVSELNSFIASDAKHSVQFANLRKSAMLAVHESHCSYLKEIGGKCNCDILKTEAGQHAREILRHSKSAARTPAPAPRLGTGNPVSLPPGERATLTACAQHPGGCTREQLSILTGYKRSTRDAYLQRLREKGLIDAGRDRITATDAGLDALGSSFEPLPTGAALRAYWLMKLPDGESKVLQEVIQQYPGSVTREILDDLTGFKRSTRDAYIQRLKARQLVKVDRDGVTAADTLFD